MILDILADLKSEEGDISLQFCTHFLYNDSKLLLPQITAFKKPQHELSSRMAVVARKTLFDKFKHESNFSDKCVASEALQNLNRLKSCCMNGSSQVFKVIPFLDRKLSTEEFQVWSKLRLGYPVFKKVVNVNIAIKNLMFMDNIC